jgi:ABC-type dipeptide/oligopeptide/nickel transport system permease component
MKSETKKITNSIRQVFHTSQILNARLVKMARAKGLKTSDIIRASLDKHLNENLF